uniref:uncharacterized protein LOC122584265 n=1 Tax=Erigeron canadensis TaxID=72917 RepID=UPI001CB997A3|nr:uncharacterized protein LOC122584265 [Erigeron canadensis]
METDASTSIVWNSLRRVEPRVDWAEAVWFSHCIPRHAFMMWLIMRNKLLTQDRILLWSPTRRKNMDVMCCSLCIADFDSHTHLFFKCSYSNQVWCHMRGWANMHGVQPDWNSIMQWLIARAKSRSIGNVIGRLVVVASAYYIWQERNNRIFKNHARPPDILAKLIQDTVRSRLWKLRFKKTARVVRTLEV